MNIGVTTSVIQRGKTGIAQYVFALTRALVEQPGGRELTLFVLEQDFPLFASLQNKARLVSVPEKFRPPVKNILWHQRELPRLVRQLGIEVLHVPSYRRLLWRKPCPLVATIHDLAPFHVRGKYDWKRMLYGRVIVRRLARRQDEIIAISRNTARDIIRFFGVPSKRIHVIHNGLDHARFLTASPQRARANVSHRWQLNAPFFLYVSRLEHPAKNHVRLIEAFSKFKAATNSDWQLAFGGSDWHGSESIHAAAKASPFASDIRFLGFVADAELPELYQAAGAFCYPSLFEGFGFPPVEAMACGCPVISSTRGALAEVVGDAAAIVNPDSVEDMQHALVRMATDSAWREHWIARGTANAQRFNWTVAAQETLQVYSRACGVALPPASTPFHQAA